MTVLGSCIAACIWDGKARTGGMNHFMLPEGEDGSGRYGSYAMELLINEMLKLGARRETMQAKVFGGGQVMAGFTTMNVGERNTKFVLDYLATERIPVVSQDVSGHSSSKSLLLPGHGEGFGQSDWRTHILRHLLWRSAKAMLLRLRSLQLAALWICSELIVVKKNSRGCCG